MAISPPTLLLAMLLATLLPSCAALLRFGSGGAPSPINGRPCIAASTLEKVIAPGMRRTLHLYDSNLIAAFRQGLALQGNNDTREWPVLSQVVLDPAAGADRSFRMLGVGTTLSVESWRPGVKENVRNEVSRSMLVDVLGVGTWEPAQVAQYEPFLAVRSAEEVEEAGREPPSGGGGGGGGGALSDDLADEAARLLRAAELIERYAPPPSPPLPTSPVIGGGGGGGGGEAVEGLGSLEARIDRVLELRGVPSGCEASRLAVRALGLTRWLPGQTRYEVLELAHGLEGGGLGAEGRRLRALVARVAEALDEEARRQVALKALKALGDEPRAGGG